MTTLWMASYVLLWVVALSTTIMLLGALRELGALRATLSGPRRTPQDVRRGKDDGPALGSPVPTLDLRAADGSRPFSTHAEDGRRAMLVFMSPLCEGCHEVVEPLNDIVRARRDRLRAIVILQGHESACNSFLRVFPVDAPVVLDLDHSISGAFGVYGRPFGLVYNERGMLIGKGTIDHGFEAILAVLGERDVPPGLDPLVAFKPAGAPAHTRR